MSEHEGPWGAPPPPQPTEPERWPRGRTPPSAPGGARRASPWRIVIWIALLAGLGGLVWFLNATFPRQLGDSDRGYLWLNVGFLTLLAGGLVRLRGITLGVVARNLAIWLAVIGVLAVGYAYRTELADARDRVIADFAPGGVSQTPHSLVVTSSDGGGFQVWGEVNGQRAPFVIDTGASDIVLTPDLARRIGLDVDHLTFNRASETANGAGRNAVATVASLTVGPIRLANVPVVINQAPMTSSLLGMAFLRRLDGFEVHGDRMTLRWRG